MEKLYAPWRHGYVTKTDPNMPTGPLKNNCVFCDQFAQNNDEKYLILKRGQHTAVVMNYYPYNAGHLMVLPLEHKANLNDLTPEVRAELMELVNLSLNVVQEALKCAGFNVGINVGETGGGGIPSHLHMHIVPRWKGDTNFMATVAETTLICSPFHELYKNFKDIFDKS
ncbi:HIT domain-containing protein [Candidatus Babeliales bacterium]|nr:HIT domain-containing protein [Candidatus Babeliales bacterium]